MLYYIILNVIYKIGKLKINFKMKANSVAHLDPIQATMVALKALSRYGKIYRIHKKESPEATIELKYSDGKREEIPARGSGFLHRIVFDVSLSDLNICQKYYINNYIH